MKPLLGMPVLFTGKHWFIKANHSAAYIAAVNSDTSVNLTVSNESGNTYGVQNVRFVSDPNDIVAGENYCQPNTGDVPFTATDADTPIVADPNVDLSAGTEEAGNASAPPASSTTDGQSSTQTSPSPSASLGTSDQGNASALSSDATRNGTDATHSESTDDEHHEDA